MNTADVVIDSGPAGLTGGGEANVPYVSVTVCASGTTTCQTIDHIIVDTGSVGLRIEKGALNTAMRTALPQTTNAGKAVGECYQYVDGYVFGSVRTADMTIGGETVNNLPLMVIGDDGVFSTVPSDCSSTGDTGHQTIADFGANGIIGIGQAVNDCGSYCAATPYLYYSCPSAGCTAAATPVALQVPNPVAQMSVDNNGTIIVLPDPGAGGSLKLNGMLYFGIGTRANNALGTHKVLTTTSSGILTATYKGTTLSQSFIDSGTNFFGFSDSSITQCTGDLAGFYCPPTSLTLSAILTGRNSATSSVTFPLNNTQNIGNNGETAIPGIGGDPNGFDALHPYSDSFDFGLPFFFGRSVYTAIQGRNADGYAGPYVAF